MRVLPVYVYHYDATTTTTNTILWYQIFLSAFDVFKLLLMNSPNYWLQMCQKRREITRLRLLLTYMQNGIAEPWQRIPSVTAIFAAEASFIMLDPSHNHYSTISNLLMRSTGVNMKVNAL